MCWCCSARSSSPVSDRRRTPSCAAAVADGRVDEVRVEGGLSGRSQGAARRDRALARRPDGPGDPGDRGDLATRRSARGDDGTGPRRARGRQAHRARPRPSLDAVERLARLQRDRPLARPAVDERRDGRRRTSASSASSSEARSRGVRRGGRGSGCSGRCRSSGPWRSCCSAGRRRCCRPPRPERRLTGGWAFLLTVLPAGSVRRHDPLGRDRQRQQRRGGRVVATPGGATASAVRRPRVLAPRRPARPRR